VITKSAFSVGLGRLAVAARQTLDVPTLTVYHEALAEEADPDTWDAFTRKAAKDGEFRDLTGTVWFPKLPDLREAYARSTRVLPFVRPPIRRDPVDEHAEYLQAVRANPKGANEGAMAYIVRIAETVEKGRLAPAGKPMPVSRIPGEEG